MAKPPGKQRPKYPWRHADQRGRIFPTHERVPITSAGFPARVLHAPGNTILDARGNLRTLPGGYDRKARFIEAVTRKMKAQEVAKAAAEARVNAAGAKPRLPHTITERQLLRILEVLGYQRTQASGGAVFTRPGKPTIHLSFTKSTQEISPRTTKMKWAAPLIREFLEKGHTL